MRRCWPRGLLSRDKEKSAYDGSLYLTTWEHGAVTLRLENGKKVVETFRTSKRWRLR